MQNPPVSPRDHEHLTELLRHHQPFAGIGEDLAEMRPGTFLLGAAGVNTWIQATGATSPVLRLSACVFGFTRSPVPYQRRQQVLRLARDLHDRSGSTSTRLDLRRGDLWLWSEVTVAEFDPVELRERAGSFVDVAVQVVGPVQWRFHGPGLLNLAASS